MGDAELQFVGTPASDGIAPDSARLRRASWASTTRRVRGPLRTAKGTSTPTPGDLLLARVDAIGFHSCLQLPDGRRKRLFVGDEIVVAYGNRYAPNQFEAVVPRSFGPCQLVAGGGVAARVLSWHDKITKEATQITPLARVAGATDAPASEGLRPSDARTDSDSSAADAGGVRARRWTRGKPRPPRSW